MRQHGQCFYNRLKTASRQLVADVGGLKKAAELSRVGLSTLGTYQNQTDAESFMPLDVVTDLESFASRPFVSEVLAASCGAILIRLPDVCTGDVTGAALAGILKETGEVVAAAGKALADGKLSGRERDNLMMQVDEACHALVVFRQVIAGNGGDNGKA